MNEEPGAVELEKIPNLRAAFLRDDSGTVTAVCSSLTCSDNIMTEQTELYRRGNLLSAVRNLETGSISTHTL